MIKPFDFQPLRFRIKPRSNYFDLGNRDISLTIKLRVWTTYLWITIKRYKIQGFWIRSPSGVYGCALLRRSILELNGFPALPGFQWIMEHYTIDQIKDSPKYMLHVP